MREKIGKFDIVRLIGQGAMGEVYLGRDPILDRSVAVKTIRANSGFGEEATARFEREARAAGALNHPNVAMIYEFGVDEGLHYLAMEYVEGEDLDALIRAGGTPMAELLDLLAQACDAIACAHDHHVVHRDIKPANILVSHRGKRPQAKLVDFGVALMGNSELTQKGDWLGTVNYMAPEYLDSGQAGPACDQFALGVILYEIITGGRRPFSGETPTSILTAILRQPPSPFRPEETQALNPALLEVVNKALAKRPEDRFASVDLLATAIRAAWSNPLATPVPVPVPSPAPPASREHPGPTLVVGKGGKGQCMSLRVALRQATPGTEILVMPGIYRESLLVDKDVVITGQGAPGEVIIESLKGPCLALAAPLVRLSNLMLTALAPGPALTIDRGHPSVEGCLMDASGGPAVAVCGAGAEPTLRDCTLRGAGGVAVLAQGQCGPAFEDCLLEGDFLTGLQLEGGARATMQRCRVLNAGGVGLRLWPGCSAVLTDCLIQGQEAGGIEVEAEARVELRHCRITDSESIGLLVLERGQASLEDCEVLGHGLCGVHAVAGAVVQLRNCRVRGNPGLGVAVMGTGLLTLDLCELNENLEPAVLVHRGATVQMKGCKIFDGQSFGIVCAEGGKGVLEGCEIYGNTKTGAKVEPGGSLLLVRCDLRDGRETGILLFEDAEVTLEECVVHRNARGGILLAKDAADPILRGGNKIQDDLLRTDKDGAQVKVSPVRHR